MKKYLALAAPVMALAMTSCSSEEFAPAGDVAMVEIPVQTEITVLDTPTTRTDLKEVEGNLEWSWEVGDKVVATDLEGNYKGTLSVTEVNAEDAKTATFEGNLNVTATSSTQSEQMTFHYLGKGFDEFPGVRGSFNMNIAEQSGDINDLVKRDVLTSNEVIDVKVNQNFTLIPRFSLGHVTAVGHFDINLPEGEEVATVTVSGQNFFNNADLNLGKRMLENKALAEGTTGITVNSDDFYITLIPNEKVTFHFDVVSKKGNNYVADLCYNNSTDKVEFDLEGGMFLRKNLGYGGLAPEIAQGFTYVLEFDNNGGEGAPATMTAPGPGTGNVCDFTIPAAEMIKGRNFTFLGWKDGDNEVLLRAGEKVTLTKDAPTKKLVAQWEQKSVTFNISYNANGESVTGMPRDMVEATQMGAESTTITFAIAKEMNKIITPSREGYEFLGWKADNEGETLAGGSNYSLTEPAKTSVTFYAQWAKVETFTLTFDANAEGLDLTGNVPTVDRVKTTKGEATFTIPACDLKVNGLVFKGWSTDKNAKDATYANDGKATITVTDKNTVLYGVWGQGNTGGSGGNMGGFDPTDPSNRN